mgnify:CR=1 FL=1
MRMIYLHDCAFFPSFSSCLSSYPSCASCPYAYLRERPRLDVHLGSLPSVGVGIDLVDIVLVLVGIDPVACLVGTCLAVEVGTDPAA